MKEYEFLEHTADVKFRAFGKNLEEVFENSAKALVKTICEEKINKKRIRKMELGAKDLEGLLYEFLEEILFLIETKGIIFAGVKRIKIDKKFRLIGEFYFDENENYEIHLDVKAITYNEMFVKKEKGKWISQVVLDV
jgi:SHS2 domain-containing protein